MEIDDQDLQKESVPQDSSALSTLKRRLSELRNNEDEYLYDSEEERIQKTKKAISIFVKSAIKHQYSSVSFVKKKLNELYEKDYLIHREEILEYGISEVEKFSYSECIQSSSTSPSLTDQSKKRSPLFCKENVYHACLCCKAISTCTHENIKAFFEDKVQSNDHKLEEVSMSLSDHYLIAKNQNTFIIAFSGERSFTSWFGKCENQQCDCGCKFVKGIEPYVHEVPLRFLVKQLLVEKNRIIFAGFSSGGLVACLLLAMLWKDNSFIGSDELKANTMCLTFGQPIVKLSCVADLVQKYPEFTTTLHHVYLKSDLIPRIFLCAANKQISLVMTEQSKLLRYKPFLYYLGKLQQFYSEESFSSSCKELQELKQVILAASSYLIIQGDKSSLQLVGTQYLITTNNGFLWKPLAHENALKELGPLKLPEVEALSCENLFKNHTIQEYFSCVFASYLNKPSQMKVADPVSSVSDVAITKPTATSIAFHQHGKELAITLEGDSLWFVHSIEVRTLGKLSINAMTTNQNSVQFNLQCKPDQLDVASEEEVQVTIESRFCAPTNVCLKVTKKLYEITARQEQLAKHKPSEIIELAFLTALLERQLNEEFKLSHKTKVIHNFLEEVVKLVPLESLFYALGCGDDDIIEDCCKAFLESKLPNEIIVPSEMLLNGMNLALQRLCTGRKFREYHFHRPHKFSERIATMTIQVRNWFSQTESHISTTHSSSSHTRVSMEEHQYKQLHTDDSPQKTYPFPFYQPVMVFSQFNPMISQVTPNVSSSQHGVIKYLRDYLQAQTRICLNAICAMPISSVYPAASLKSTTSHSVIPPIDLLTSARAELQSLAREAITAEKKGHKQLQNCSTSPLTSKMVQNTTALYNRRMLDKVTNIRKKQKLCSTLLGAFMEAQVQVPLIKSAHNTAKVLGKTAIAAVGMWALLSMPYIDMQSLLSEKFSSLFVEVAKFIHGTYFETNNVENGDEYAGKLQFLLQGMVKTVSCNSRYISYSLEQQLKEQCSKLGIDASTDLKKLIDNWDIFFKQDVLSLVTHQSRGLVARWLKWSLLIHNLREELAKYTSVGIVGLVNSGKSVLVSSLFNIPIPAGTRESKRTTIPFIYNLGEKIPGLDVIDFPGVDDCDETIPELAELLFSLTQIVVFVVDYKKAHTKATQEWLDRLAKENIYVLVCLTYADKLYAELMDKGGRHPNPAAAKQELLKQAEIIIDKLGQSPNRTVYLTTLSQDKDSVLNTDDGRKKLMKAGLKCHFDVGDWLVKTLDELQHNQLAVKMTAFLESKKRVCHWY